MFSVLKLLFPAKNRNQLVNGCALVHKQTIGKEKIAQTFTSQNCGALKILSGQSSCEVLLHFQKSN